LIPIHGSAPVPGSTFATGPRPIYPPSEALTHDWNKYRDTIVATAGVDQIIRTFDIRNTRAGPTALLQGHHYAVRKIAWSPHLSDVLLSASYDMTAKVWTDGTTSSYGGHPSMPTASGGPRELGSMDAHTEFVTGVDWCLFGAEGWVASTAWDERVLVWDVRTIMRP
jgi:peroxin-7